MDDYYQFDEEAYCLVGEKTGHTYRLGQKVTVKVSQVDLSTKSIVSRFLIGGFPLGGRLISASVYKGICQIRSHNDQNHDQDPEPENAVFPFHLFRHLSALLPQ